MHTDLNHRTVAERLRALPEEAQAPYDWDEFQRRTCERAAGVHSSRRYAAVAAAVVLVIAGLAVWGRFTVHWDGGSREDHRQVNSGLAASGPADRPTGGSPASNEQASSAGQLASATQSGAASERSSGNDAVPGPSGVEASDARGGSPKHAAHHSTAGQSPAPLPRDVAPARAVAESGRASESRGHALEVWLASLPEQPAVVRVGTRAAAAGLEDRIAQIDDLLSVERVNGGQPARLASLQQERAQLISSLVQVRYAETLVAESR